MRERRERSDAQWQLVEPIFRPRRLIGEQAYDSDRPDRDLAERNSIELINADPPRAPDPEAAWCPLCAATGDVGATNGFSLCSIIFVGS